MAPSKTNSSSKQHLFNDKGNILNGIIEFIGFIISASGLVLLIVKNTFKQADFKITMAYTLFYGGLIIYYGLLSFGKIFYISKKVNKAFNKLSYCFLPIMIATCFMPVCFIELQGKFQWTLFILTCIYAIFSVLNRALQTKNNALKSIVVILLCLNSLYTIVLLTHVIPVVYMFFLSLGGLLYAVSVMINPYKLIHYENRFINCRTLSSILMILGTMSHLYVVEITMR